MTAATHRWVGWLRTPAGGVDPTRVGSLLGLTEMGRIKTQVAADAEAEEAGVLPAAAPAPAVSAAPPSTAPGTPCHGYGKGSSQREDGEPVAAFTGSHGWFWRNRTGEPLTIALQTTGACSEVRRVV
ncbi:hypothetical protein [Brevundimonas sp.]|uniref:hypothetical protein n=1 Tax=Brevundimonas sp. TaxID=1871086 RepID=UPI002BB3B1C1|nr:hypothetical protein [Brevundimonas sp.]HWQ85720.1 hypothetical protein [Brevundimonas sp.]